MERDCDWMNLLVDTLWWSDGVMMPASVDARRRMDVTLPLLPVNVNGLGRL